MADEKDSNAGKGHVREATIRTGKLIKPEIIEPSKPKQHDASRFSGPSSAANSGTPPNDRENNSQQPDSQNLQETSHSLAHQALAEQPRGAVQSKGSAKKNTQHSPTGKSQEKTLKKNLPEGTPRPAWVRQAAFLAVAITVIVTILYIGGVFDTISLQKQFSSYETRWKNGDYKNVLVAATNENKEAAQMIVLKAAHGELELPKDFRADILNFGLNPLWEKSLSSEDKQALYTYASSSVLGAEAKNTASPDSLHPGVLLAVIGNLGLQAPLGKFGEITTEKFADLPSPFGIVFKKLNDLKIDTIAAPQARALARIMTNHDDEETIAFTLASAQSENELLDLVRLAAPFGEKSANLAANFLKNLAIRPDTLGQRVRWFNEPSGVNWGDMAPLPKLFLVTSILLDDIKTDDALIDLTLFPDATIREAAIKKLSANPQTEEIFKLIRAASLNQIFITRPQLVGLNSLLRMPELSRDAFVAQWFQTNPDVRIVLFLLLEREKKSPNDIFNLNAAEYLAAHNESWNASFDTLKRLSLHPEPLARTLAFGRLNPEYPEQRKILQDWQARETSPNIKEQLGERLKISAS